MERRIEVNNLLLNTIENQLNEKGSIEISNAMFMTLLDISGSLAAIADILAMKEGFFDDSGD